MKLRGLLIAAVVLAALSGAVYWSNKAEKAKEGKPSPDAAPKIVEIPEDQLQQVEIRKKAGEDTVLKKEKDGKWEITAPKPLNADQDAVKSVMSTVSSLSSDRLVEDKGDNLGNYGLVSPSLEVVVNKKDGKSVKLLIGDETPTGSAYFAKLENDPRIFTVASYNKSSLDKTSSDLRDKRLLTFDSDKLSRLELTAKGQTIEVGKNNQNDWQILKPRPLRADGGNVEQLIGKLRDAKMDTSLLSEADMKKAASAFASAKPVAVAKVTDAAGTQQLEVRKAKDNTYYARSNVLEGVYKVTSDIGDGLDKGLEDLRNKKLFDFGWSDPSKIEIRDGDMAATYEKSSDKWMRAGKQMDSTSVRNLIDKLRDLSSTKFVDKGFTTPVFEATVTSNEGKRVEKVLISKNGNDYFAKRENEPSIYQLDAQAVEELQQAAKDVKEPEPPKKDEKKKS
jgi:hypothetical protein